MSECQSSSHEKLHYESRARLMAPKVTKDLSATGELIKVEHYETRYAGGVVSWSILPGSVEDSSHGSLTICSGDEVSDSKSRRWCVIMDRMLYTYIGSHDIRAQVAVELKYFYSVTNLENGITALIRRKPPIDAWYFIISTDRFRREWTNILSKLIAQTNNSQQQQSQS